VLSTYANKYSNTDFIDGQNHIVHHMLTIFALGASPEQLEKAYDLNQYQRPAIPQHDLADKMTNLEEFSKYLGQEEYFSDYLEYFTREMEKTSWQEVVNEYLFKKDARAEDMLTRTFAGMNFAHSHSALPHAHMFVDRIFAPTHPSRFWDRFWPACHCCRSFSPSSGPFSLDWTSAPFCRENCS
jgi:hypothetical protein